MSRHAKTAFTFLLAGLFSVVLTGRTPAQEMSGRREIAVFRLSHYNWRVPAGTLEAVDEQVGNLFVRIGRFDVVRMAYRFDAANVQELLEGIKQATEQDAELPEVVRLGREAFTRSDFDRIVGSAVVVVPSVTFYQAAPTERGAVRAELETLFTFIDVAEASVIDSISVRVSGTADSPQQAARLAAEAITPRLRSQVKTIPVFQLRTGVVDVDGRSVLLAFGADMGVSPGDEYAIVTPRVLPSGEEVVEETGMMIVKNVTGDLSTARLILSSRRPQAGDLLREIPRIGFDTSLYVHTLLTVNPFDPAPSVVGVFGARQSTSRGFFTLRPFIGVEVPIPFGDRPRLPGFVGSLYGGGELNWYFGRFVVAPSAALGIGASPPTGSDASRLLSHVGGKVHLRAGYLVNRDIIAFVEAGYAAWIGLSQAFDSTYAGIVAGVGATYKY